jgi:formylmethanofuran dehydrogenase subunit E
MLQGLLKMWMLKIISEGEVNGYQIIKKVNALTGKKPSTGSVYPLLKSMQSKGWIIGRKLGGKTLYKITASGRKVVAAHGSMKRLYEQKISGSLSLAHDTFDDLHVGLVKNSAILNPVTNEVSSLLAHGVAPEKISAVLSRTLVNLHKLKNEVE